MAWQQYPGLMNDEEESCMIRSLLPGISSVVTKEMKIKHDDVVMIIKGPHFFSTSRSLLGAAHMQDTLHDNQDIVK